MPVHIPNVHYHRILDLLSLMERDFATRSCGITDRAGLVAAVVLLREWGRMSVHMLVDKYWWVRGRCLRSHYLRVSLLMLFQSCALSADYERPVRLGFACRRAVT